MHSVHHQNSNVQNGTYIYEENNVENTGKTTVFGSELYSYRLHRLIELIEMLRTIIVKTQRLLSGFRVCCDPIARLK